MLRTETSSMHTYDGTRLLQTTARFHLHGSNDRGAHYSNALRPRQINANRKHLRRSDCRKSMRDSPPLLSLHSDGKPRHTGRLWPRSVVSGIDPSSTVEWGTTRSDGFAPPTRTLFAGGGVSQQVLLPSWVVHCRKLRIDRRQMSRDESWYQWQLAVGYRCHKLLKEWHKVAFLTRFLKRVFERCNSTKHMAAFRIWKDNSWAKGPLEKWKNFGKELFKRSTIGIILQMIRRMNLLIRVLKRVFNLKLAAGFAKLKFVCIYMYNAQLWKQLSITAWRKMHPVYILMRRFRFIHKAVKRITNIWLAAGWYKWHEDQLSDLKVFKKKILLKILNRIMLRGWRVWYAQFAKERWRRLLTGMINRMQNRELAIAWQKWEHVFKDHNILRWIMSKILKVSTFGLLTEAISKWKSVPISQLGRPRLGHCDCVYRVLNELHCRCSFEKHFANRMQKLRNEVDAALEGKPGSIGGAATHDISLSVGIYDHTLSVAGNDADEFSETKHVMSISRYRRTRQNRHHRILSPTRRSIEEFGFGTSKYRHSRHTMTKW